MAEETKESFLLDNQTPSSTNWETEGFLGSPHPTPRSPRLPLQGDPWSRGRVPRSPGKPGLKGPGGWSGTPGSPTCLPTQATRSSMLPLKWKGGGWRVPLVPLAHRLRRSGGAREPASPPVPPGASASGLTRRFKVRRNIASRAEGCRGGLRPRGLSAKAPSTKHTAAWARGAKRPASSAAPPPARSLPSSPLRAPAPARSRARRPALPGARPQRTPARPARGRRPRRYPYLAPAPPGAPAVALLEASPARARGGIGGRALGSPCTRRRGGVLQAPPSAPGSAPRAFH